MIARSISCAGLWLLAVGGCKHADTGDTDTDTDLADSDTDVVDTDVPRSGAEGQSGTGTMDGGSYLGVEEWYFVGADGYGADICRIGYTLTSTDPRTDCADCSWAYDLVLSDAHVIDETDPGCEAVLAIDPVAVSDLDGKVVSYGYAPSYFGHAKMLMMDLGNGWTAVTFAAFDDTTGAFEYDWEAGYREY